MNTQGALPVSLPDRSDILDVLRGFALLGILMDNIIGFTGWGFLSQLATVWFFLEVFRAHRVESYAKGTWDVPGGFLCLKENDVCTVRKL